MHTPYGNPAKSIAQWLQEKTEHRTSPLIVAIGGPGGTGKSTFTKSLMRDLPKVAHLSLDDFRLPRARRAAMGLYGSHPDGNDLKRLRRCIALARRGLSFAAPVFDQKAGETLSIRQVEPQPILLCDGEIAAHDALGDLFDHLIIVTAHWRTQLDTRLGRDISRRAHSLEKAIDVFLNSNLRDYPRFSGSAHSRADWLLYRSRRGRLTVKKQPE